MWRYIQKRSNKYSNDETFKTSIFSIMKMLYALILRLIDESEIEGIEIFQLGKSDHLNEGSEDTDNSGILHHAGNGSECQTEKDGTEIVRHCNQVPEEANIRKEWLVSLEKRISGLLARKFWTKSSNAIHQSKCNYL